MAEIYQLAEYRREPDGMLSRIIPVRNENVEPPADSAPIYQDTADEGHH